VALVAVFTLCACPSFSNLKTARALDKGQYEITLAAEAIGASNFDTANGTGSGYAYPQFEIAARFGIADGLDLGFKVYPIGIELDGSIQLLRGSFDLSLDPGVGISGSGFTTYGPEGSTGASFFVVPLHLDLLGGINLGTGGTQIVFGPGVYGVFGLANSISDGASQDGNSATLLVGGTLGISVALLPILRVMPEFDIYFPVAGHVSSTSLGGTSSGANGTFIYTFALGFSLGNGSTESRQVPAAH
jgi:hypothetical protein